jgi:putative tricarboxylic transport membrane protein
MVGLLSGETQVLSTGLSEAIALADQGEVRILAMTAPDRLSSAPSIPTLAEQGVPAVFSNWRGFFAAPGTSDAARGKFSGILEAMYQTPEWQSIRDARGWTDSFISGDEFARFLAQQEQDMAELLKDLGLLE